MNNNLQKYTEYKDSGVEWLGEIPSHWNEIKLKINSTIYNGDSLNENKKAKYESDDESHLAYISSKDIDLDTSIISYENGLRIPKNESKYKVAKSNSSLICIEGGSAGRKIAFTNQDVCFVNKLACVSAKNNFNSKYLFYTLKGSLFQTQFKLAMSGMIGGVAISSINNFYILEPSRPEQTAIANFLDLKTAQIDNAIAIKQKQIELLKERRQILIHNAVTRGLNPNAKMKDSGLEWIGEIPEGWEVKKLKYILKERNERSDTGEEPLFMMSQVHGLVVRADYHKKAEVAQTSEGNKIVYTNDLVFNKLKAHLGVFFKSTIDFNGLVSPDYAVYYSNEFIPDLKYLELLFRCPEYLKEFICRITGIVEGLMRLYTQDLFDIAVPVPPLNEQIVILKYIDSIDSKIATAITLKEQEIEKLKEYKGTLINGAVTGKIKVV